MLVEPCPAWLSVCSSREQTVESALLIKVGRVRRGTGGWWGLGDLEGLQGIMVKHVASGFKYQLCCLFAVCHKRKLQPLFPLQ